MPAPNVRAGVAALLVVAAGRAGATLGEPLASADRDRAALSMAEGSTVAVGGVTVRELKGSTVTIREFADSSGKVFAVAWEGLTRPDLAILLGSYHDEYSAALPKSRTGRGPRRLEAEHVVVETWGHARSLHGRAFLPALLPPGTRLDDVR